MSLMTAMEVGATGLTAQRRRLEVMVSNLVNANTTQPQGVEPYRRRDVVFASKNMADSFGTVLDDAVQGVEIIEVATDQSDPLMRYEPNHPHADANGYVAYPNVNPLEEMVNVMSSTRSYEANLQAVGMAKEMLQRTLDILR
ncbi:MAG: flagellar basal body rod protein FlgC [Acidobacteriota bacterium]|jgi:flagellar basal-body rod protein FlgC|nr:flagellar basal body rod protein FlgC [Acidobacteriota bacterium]